MSFAARRAANARRAAQAAQPLADVPTDPKSPQGPGGTPGTPPLPGDWGPNTRWGPQGTPGPDPQWLTKFPWYQEPGHPGSPYFPLDPYWQNRRHIQAASGGDEHQPPPPGGKSPFKPVYPGGPPPGSIDPNTGLPVLGDTSAGAPPGFRPKKSSNTSRAVQTRGADFAPPPGAGHVLGKEILGPLLGRLIAMHMMNQAQQNTHDQLSAQGIIEPR